MAWYVIFVCTYYIRNSWQDAKGHPLMTSSLGASINDIIIRACLKYYRCNKPLFPPSRLCVHATTTFVCHKIFFSLKSPWNHPLTPGVDPWGWPRVAPGHTAPPEELARAQRALSSEFLKSPFCEKRSFVSSNSGFYCTILTLKSPGGGGISPRHFQRLAILRAMKLWVSNLHVNSFYHHKNK